MSEQLVGIWFYEDWKYPYVNVLAVLPEDYGYYLDETRLRCFRVRGIKEPHKRTAPGVLAQW